MAEPTFKVKSVSYASADRGASAKAYASDVLLIADEPRVRRGGRDGRSAAGAGAARQEGAPEPLDMESVVRRLIALLSEETLP